MWPGEAMGQGWPQVGELALAFLRSALIGLEREVRQKSAVLIFVRRDNVRGLTTAAIVWMTAAVGMACGAGLPVLVVAAGHFIVVFTFPHLVGHLPKSRWTPSVLQVSYEDRREILREVLVVRTQHDFAVSRLRVERTPAPGDAEPPGRPGSPRIATVVLVIQGLPSVSKLAAKLADIDWVVSVNAGDSNVPTE